MKKRMMILLSVVACICCGCYSEVENSINQLERRVKQLEDACAGLNTNVASLKTIVETIESYDYVTKVVTNKDEFGRVLGYTIYFTHSNPVTIFNGTSAETPVIGVKAGSDGLFYWTIKYGDGEEEFVRADNGTMIAATAISPVFRIVDGKWQVSYDGGEIWKTNYNGADFGNATGESPQSFFSKVEDSVDYVKFTFSDSSVLRVPTWEAYLKLCEAVDVTNSNLSALGKLYDTLKTKNYVKSVTPIKDEEGGAKGYTLNFADGETISVYNGVVSNRPEISAAQDEANPADKSYYWTVRYPNDAQAQWLLFSGQKVRASAFDGIVPQLAVNPDTTLAVNNGIYYWMISYNNGGDFSYMTDGNGNKVRASIASSTGLDSVKVSADRVDIKISNVWHSVSRMEDFEVKPEKKSVTMSAADTTVLIVDIPQAKLGDGFTILPVTEDGFYAEVIHHDIEEYETRWWVRIFSPATFTGGSSRLTLLVSDGKGALKSTEITIKFGN